MGIENMRRWPMYIVFAVCMLLLLSLFNSWTLETELRQRIAAISTQLERCSKLEAACMEESLTVLEQRDKFKSKANTLDEEKSKLADEINDFKMKISKYNSRINHTLVDVELCKTELQSLKNLQVSKTATLETLRLEKDTLTTQLTERKHKIDELEKEIERLKTALTTKSTPKLAPPASQATPAASLPKLSPVMNAPLDEPALENAAREEMEDSNPQDMDDPMVDPNLQ